MSPAITVSLSKGNLFLLLVLLGGAVGWTIIFYRRARLKGRISWILPTLRSLSLALLLFVIFSPLLGLVFSSLRSPLVAVLIDTSESMSLEDVSSGRIGVAEELISEDGPVRRFEKAVELRFLQFSDRLYPLAESLHASGKKTEIGSALANLEKEIGEKPQGAVLLTDGGNNSGPEPIRVARRLGFPVFPIGIGSSAGRRDCSIESVELNEICYAGDSVPVRVVVRSEGFLGERSKVSLLEGEKTLSSAKASLTREAWEQSLELFFVPRKPGIHTYELLVSPQPGELSEENNRRSVRVEVLKSRIKVVSISSHPSWDLKFLGRSMAFDPNIEMASLTGLGEDRWLLQRREGEEIVPLSGFRIREWDVLVLENIRDGELPRDLTARIARLLESKGGGLVLWGKVPSELSPLSPLIEGRGDVEREFSMKVTEVGLSHAIMRLSRDLYENRKVWEGLPPLAGCSRSLGAKGGSEVLAVHPREKTAQGLMPVMALQRYGKGKVLQICAWSLWRWALLSLSLSEEAKFYDKFWSNLFRYLSAREDLNRLIVKPAKGVFQAGEEIRFVGQVYDRGYAPLNGATVKVKVEIPGRAPEEVHLFGRGEGTYEGSMRSLPPGTYRFRSEATIDGMEVLRGGRGEVLIEEWGLEFSDVKLNEGLLRRMAEESGGKYYTPDKVEELEKVLKLEKREVEKRKEVELASNPLLYLLIVLFLGSEWLMRRRRGLP